MGPFKTYVTQEREEGKLTKNVTKSDAGEGFAAKKCDVTHSKKRVLRVTFFLNGPYDDVLLCCIFYEYLLMVSLDFYETNKSYIIK